MAPSCARRSLALLAGLLPSALVAQRNTTTARDSAPPRDYVALGLEPSYVTVPSRWVGSGFAQPRPLIFEGSIVPHLALHAWRRHDLTLVLTPKVVVRMLDTTSKPVRSPSWMPRATLTFNPWDATRPVHERDSIPVLGTFGYFKLIVSHHSNGQEDSTVIDGRPNLRSGDFSTNYVEFGGTAIREAERRDRSGRLRSRSVRLTTLSLEHHVGFAQEALRDDYGLTRLNLRITQIGSTLPRPAMTEGIVRRSGGDNPDRPYFRADLTVSYILNSARRTGADALFTNASVAYKIRELDDFWLFIGYQRGQDPYNSQWLAPRLLSAWRLGVLGTPTTVITR
ncbi:MAG: hypothetical protein MUE41_11640 [Gemmatimonadaceae bacterium]|jgi:hypothetical protein|nr:hypothetical protein [Gemmatimonadaceae bacterium]